LYPEDEDNIFIRNTDSDLPDYKLSHLKQCILHNVTWGLNARIVEPADTAVARERSCKCHVTPGYHAATEATQQ
jgi:hypothetical protein